MKDIKLSEIDHEAEPPIIPERGLLAAVLRRAITDALCSSIVPAHHRRDAMAFLQIEVESPSFEKTTGEYGFTYLELVQGLDLCPKTIHRELRKMYLSNQWTPFKRNRASKR